MMETFIQVTAGGAGKVTECLVKVRLMLRCLYRKVARAGVRGTS